jgi:hypothetical protein
MLSELNIWKLQSPEEIEECYFELNKNLAEYNSSYFHFNDTDLSKYIKCETNSPKLRFNKFKRNWENFNNHKQLLFHFFNHHRVDYPDIFKQNSRICIAEVSINFQDILEEVNVLRINQHKIPYTYYQIIYKLVKQILINHILAETELLLLTVDIELNQIKIEYKDLITDHIILKEYKLNKFLYKYQNIYPDDYKNINAWLIVSNNWQDIFLSSTFKQWTSCMNLINTYKDKKIKYSNENYVKSGALVSYLVLNTGDRKNN